MMKLRSAVLWRLGTNITVRTFSTPTAIVFKTDKTDLRNGVTDKPETSTEASDTVKNGMLFIIYHTTPCISNVLTPVF